ncbi:hypothetical protein CGMCC3_g5093 [Colletotrichum fructicola]|nr:uncharacterized protein CGMCC3_g5093 [Colletotrichum fructicola]KAE9578767.1 hypothetical protein CGMCC3_g5093 [Colletotrichum fructicola]
MRNQFVSIESRKCIEVKAQAPCCFQSSREVRPAAKRCHDVKPLNVAGVTTLR